MSVKAHCLLTLIKHYAKTGKPQSLTAAKTIAALIIANK